MKANEFLKKYGWTGFKIACQYRAINRYKYTIIWSDEIGFSNEINKIDADWTFESKEVLRLVKSHELVNSVGGLDAANRIVCDAFHGSNHPIPDGHEKLSLAIQDVEPCQ